MSFQMVKNIWNYRFFLLFKTLTVSLLKYLRLKLSILTEFRVHVVIHTDMNSHLVPYALGFAFYPII